MNWDPPEGMPPIIAARWRAFYRQALDTYGITPHDYRLLYLAQKGRCWICRQVKGIHPDDPKGRGYRRLGVDHNHVTGAVRGLLCTGGDKTCNRILGWLKDNPATFRRAAEYLEMPPARVLTVVELERREAEREGATIDAEELAVAFLWPE